MTRSRTVKSEILGYGVRAFRSPHTKIRKLKRLYAPSLFGYRVWTSSWLLMDFFKYRGMPGGTHVMDVGCGWGLAGIYCAKKHNAVVTSVDIDSEVFPYLRLHADMNEVKIVTLRKGFEELEDKHLYNIDIMIGADICFWDTMVDPLKRLIIRALGAGVQLVLIADPGRPTFDEVVKYFIKKRSGEMLYRTVQRPHRIQGRILKISALTE